MDMRHTPFNRQCTDAEREINSPSYITQEPLVFFGSTTNVHHPNVLFGNAHNNDPYHLPGHYDSFVPHAMTHCNTFHPPPANFNLGASYVPRMPPFPVNYGHASQISSHGNYLVHGGAYQENGRNHFVDGAGCSYKRKTVESLPDNNYYSNASTSTSTSFMGPTDARHPSEVRLGDSSSSYGLPCYGEDGSVALDEISSGSVRVRSGVSGLNSAHHTPNYGNSLTQGSYSSSQSFLQGGLFSLDQPSSGNSIDGGALGWSPPPPLMPFMQASNINGASMEIGSHSVQGPLEASGNRNSANFLHPPFFNAQHLPHLSPAAHGIRSRNGNLGLHPQAQAQFQRAPSRSVSHLGRFEPAGFGIQWPHNAGVVLETTNSRHHNGPHLRVSAVDEVAIIDYGEVYGVENYDHHRDMRLDIEDMSYEDLLALGELIGNVNTGLPEERIDSQLKTRTWASSLFINLEELPCEDHDAASCIICQDAYEDQDRIGTLDCGHEYHADCLKKWLLVKNVCPICKSEALPGHREDS